MSRHQGTIVAVALTLFVIWPVQAGTDWDLASTQVLIAGVLKWEDPGITRFSPRHRKDQELADTLIRKGVPKENVTVLLDEQATLKQIRTVLQERAGGVKANGSLLFYYCGHGRRGSDNKVFFCNYDAGGQAQKPDFGLEEIPIILKKHFRGARVFLLADCCHSGGLKEIARQLAAAGTPAVCLASADVRSVSTSSWIFTQTILDGLNGDPVVDTNGDGAITLEELAGEVEAAMRFREGQPPGIGQYGVPAGFKLFETDRSVKLPLPLRGPFALKEYVRAPDGAHTRPARIVGQEGDKYQVEFYDYSDKRRALVPAAKLTAIQLKSYGEGEGVLVTHAEGIFPAKVVKIDNELHWIRYLGWPDTMDEWVTSSRIVGTLKEGHTPAMVEWQKAWWPAVVLKTEKDKHRIHYVGYDSSWDEWVGPDRIRFPKPAQVEWGGKWWPAIVQKIEGEKFFIHYINYDNSWDEWVGKDRIRLAGR